MSGDEYEKARLQMVRDQLKPRGITSGPVLAAMSRIPRHAFVPFEFRHHAYDDRALPVGLEQTISQPYMVAVMTQLLDVRPGNRILEIGTGSGYQCAILAHIAAEVVTVERHEALSANARALLDALEIHNVVYAVGDGTLGWPAAAPYDGIIVTAGAPEVPESLKRQLAVGGRLVIPVGTREEQMLHVVRRTPDGYVEQQGLGCRFVPLLGEEGWPNG